MLDITTYEPTTEPGEPTVVILHGAPVTPSSVRSVVDHLSRDHRVVVPDMSRARLPPDESRAALEQALRDEDVERAALVGHSFGTYRAFGLAAGDAVEVTEIVALAPLAYYPDEVRAGHLELASALEAGQLGIPELVAALEPQWATDDYLAEHPELRDEMREWFEVYGEEGLVDYVRIECEIPDIRPELEQLDIPVYIRVGAEDAATPPEWSREIAEILPNASLDVVEGAGHFIHREDREGTLAAIDAFLEE
jgi:3-oxoadipate enol-lactonase